MRPDSLLSGLGKALYDLPREVKLLHATISNINDVNIAVRIARKRPRRMETSRLAARLRHCCVIGLAPNTCKLPCLGIENLYPMVSAICDEKRVPLLVEQ